MSEEKKDTGFFVPTQEKQGDVSRSLEGMIRAYFTSTDPRDIFSSSDFSAVDIYALATGAVHQHMAEIMSTDFTLDEINTVEDPDIRSELIRRLWKRNQYLSDPVSAGADLFNEFRYYYSLGRQSLNRKSREEAVEIASAEVVKYKQAGEVGRLEQLRGRLLGDNIVYK